MRFFLSTSGGNASMFKGLFSTLRSNAIEMPVSRRRHLRREVDRCVAVVNGTTYPIENWSLGGILLAGDERFFSVGQDMMLTLKFKLRNTIINLEHKGIIIRKTDGRIAVEFIPLSGASRRGFQQVIDDSVASEFVNSQV